MSRLSDDRRQAERIEEAVVRLRQELIPNKEAIDAALKRLVEWNPERSSAELFKTLEPFNGKGMYSPAQHKCATPPKYATTTQRRECRAAGCVPGDDEAPFLSEAYLYNLLGKEDARTLLALMHTLLEAVGYDRITQRETFGL